MNRGYILVFSLIVLIISSSILTISLQDLRVASDLLSKTSHINERLEAEAWIVKEALFYASFELDDEISETYGDYDFLIEIIDHNITINVSGKENYLISMQYDSDCACFIEILYR